MLQGVRIVCAGTLGALSIGLALILQELTSFTIALKWSKRRIVKNMVIAVSQAEKVIFFSGAILLQ